MFNNTNLNSKPFRLGIWGVSQSGKTVYLSRLYKILEENDWKTRIRGESKDFFEDAIQKVNGTNGNGKREFPRSTDILDGNIKTCKYLISHKNFKNTGNKVEAIIEFIDIPGEYYGGDNRYRYREDFRITIDDRQVTLIDYFLSCDGILFLLDYERDGKEKTYENHQRKLLEDLFKEMDERQEELNSQGDKKIKELQPYVAFAVSKADREEIDNSGLSSIRLVGNALGFTNPTKMISWFNNYFHVDRSKLERQIDNGDYEDPGKYHRCQFFSISAIGFYWDAKFNKWKSGVIAPETNNSNSQTQNVDDVFETNSSTSRRFQKKPKSDPNKKPKLQIIQGVDLEPQCVVEPIEWFIEAILKNRPTLPTVPNTPLSSNDSYQKEYENEGQL